MHFLFIEFGYARPDEEVDIELCTKKKHLGNHKFFVDFGYLHADEKVDIDYHTDVDFVIESFNLPISDPT